MSKYTTSLEVILSSQSNHEFDLYERIKSGKKFLFDFDYPVPNEDFKESFEMQFCEKYYVEEIGFETVPLFKMKLKQRLEMLMPEVIFKYNALQKIIEIENPALERSGESQETGHNTSTVDGNGTSNSGSQAKNIGSRTPANIISADDIGDVTYASDGNMSEGSQNSQNTSHSEGTSDNSIERTFKEYGNQLKSYVEYYNSYFNIMRDLLKSLDDLFLPVLF